MGAVTHRRSLARRALTLVVAASLTFAAGPGCIIGSPIAAISGEPYGMTIDDVDAIGGDRRPIWGGHPIFAAIDLPFAAVLDTAFLPISLIIWGISAAVDGGSESEGHHGDGHRRDAEGDDIDEDEYGGRDRDRQTHDGGASHADDADDDDGHER